MTIADIRQIYKQYPLKKIVVYLDFRYGFGLIERLIACNWFNPLLTIWLNFRSFPLSQACFFPVSVYGRPKVYGLSGRMKIIGKVTFGMVKFNQTKPAAPSNMGVQSEIFNNGLIIFRGKGLIGTGNKIFVASGKTLDIGANFKITDMCNIGCFSGITIGEQSWIVHRCQILDANYHYVANFTKGVVPKWSSPIYIGKGCWICNTSTVSGGTVLPNFTIVASNSLVNKDYSHIPESSIIGGIPAKFIATGFRKVEHVDVEQCITHYYKEHSAGMFQIPEDDTPELYSTIYKFR